MDQIEAREANERRLPQIMPACGCLETRKELAQGEPSYFSKSIVCWVVVETSDAHRLSLP
jgi:hypothetical protein